MDNNQKVGIVSMEIAGIQKFIFSGKKLSEMINASEITENIFKNDLDAFVNDKKNGYKLIKPFTEMLIKTDEFEDEHSDPDGKNELNTEFGKNPPQDNEILGLQINAGITNLVFSSSAKAKEFLKKFSLEILEKYPAIPFYGASAEVDWSLVGSRECKAKCEEIIRRRRCLDSYSKGMLMQPFCIACDRDGFPCIPTVYDEFTLQSSIKNPLKKGKNGNIEKLSLQSAIKNNESTKAEAEKRLHYISLQKYKNKRKFEQNNLKWEWTNDLKDIVGDDNKIALIHMDGNDLGKLFLGQISKLKGKSTPERLQTMAKLSACVDKCNQFAMNEAVNAVLEFESLRIGEDHKTHKVPLRPIVVGGDDVTILIRADLSALFTLKYVKAFEQKTKELNEGKALSLGAAIVVASSSYPFAKAFTLAESVLDSAKTCTATGYGSYENRPSSIDYLVVTNDVEYDIEDIRKHLYTATDGSLLTAKPFVINRDGKNETLRFEDVIADGIKVITGLPRGTLRGLLTTCRNGKDVAKKIFEQVNKNVSRQLGGRNNNDLLKEETFNKIFKENFFTKYSSYGQDKYRTLIGDYLELTSILPKEIIVGDFKNSSELKDLFFEHVGISK